MPQVKGYGSAQVRQAGIPAARGSAVLSPEGAGLAMGQAITQAAATYYRDEVDRQDQVAFLEADRKLSEWENKALYDPANGALSKRGKEAFSVPDSVAKDFDSTVQGISSSLSTDRQRVAFERAVAARRKDINTTLSRHVFQESRKFEDAETTAYLKNAAESAVLNSHDPERVRLELDRGIAAIAGHSQRNGLGAEYEKQARSEFLSKTTVGIVERFLANGQDRTAKEYFEKNKALIAGDDITRVEAKLSVAIREGEGLRAGVEIWDRIGPKSDMDPVQLDKLFKDAESKYAGDPGMLKAVKGALTERANVHNSAQRERSESNSSAVWNAIEKGAGLNQVRSMPEYLALPGKEKDSIKNHIIDRSDVLKRRAEGQGDDALYYDLITMSSTRELQDGFLTRNLHNDRAKLSRQQFNHLVEVQAALRKGDNRGADKLLASEKQQKQIIDEALLGMKLDPTPNERTPKEKIEQINGFRRSVREAVRAHETRTGKNATDAEVQSIVDGLIIEGVTKKRGFWFDESKRVYQIQPGENIIIKATDVPRSEKTKIEAALRANGKAVTDEAIVDLYTRRLLQLRGTRAQ